MGFRELLLTLGAITIFGITVVNTNRRMVKHNDEMLRTEFEYYAVSLAQSYIEEAKTRAFDENIISSTPAILPDDFTSPGALGPDSESYETRTFDDIDDFHGYSVYDSSGRDVFDLTINVGYVQSTNPDSLVNFETFYKKMTVSVDNRYLDSPVNMSYVFGYLEN